MTRQRGRTAGKTMSQRQLRVGEELRHSLARILEREELRDPALRDATVTVTEVRVSPDLRNATAYVVPLGGENMEGVLQGLRRAAPHFRSLIAREIRLKFVPNLFFEPDASFEQASRIDALLRKVAAPHNPDDVRGRDDEHET